MREIKFRAWHKEHKSMTFFDWVKVAKDQYQMQNLCDLLSGIHPDGEIMQYTGLKDQNGKGAEMCQGDLVRAYGYGIGEVVKNYWGEWGLDLNEVGFESFHDLMMEQDLGEIVGTIYENPELLEVVK